MATYTPNEAAIRTIVNRARVYETRIGTYSGGYMPADTHSISVPLDKGKAGLKLSYSDTQDQEANSLSEERVKQIASSFWQN